jgi:hypothetical protein
MTPRSDGRTRTHLAGSSEIVVAELPSNIIGSATENPTFNQTNPYRWVALCLISWMSIVSPRVRHPTRSLFLT